MNAKEIKKLHKLIDGRIKEISQEFLEKKDDNLADLANHEGWKVLRQVMEDMLYELLTPIGIESTGTLEVLAIVNESRKSKIEILKTILALVESTSQAKLIMKKESPED